MGRNILRILRVKNFCSVNLSILHRSGVKTENNWWSRGHRSSTALRISILQKDLLSLRRRSRRSPAASWALYFRPQLQSTTNVFTVVYMIFRELPGGSEKTDPEKPGHDR